jgi:uncharacterized membrane protein YdjX (TVP38/TMEM64 family)
LASAATIGVPFGLVIFMFVGTWLGNSTSGAGLSEDNRPIAVYMLSGIGAFGWFMATSALYAVHRPADGLPRTARAFAMNVIWDSHSNQDGTLAARTTASIGRLIGLALVLLPLLMFLPPLMLGLLAQGRAWRAEEAASVVVMGAIVGSWSVFLAERAWITR